MRSPLLAASILVLAGCRSEEVFPPPTAFADPAGHSIHVGLETEERGEAGIAQIMAARLTDSGRHVVVLDAVAPFVKVYTSRNRLHAAFVTEGDGPGEARRPTALAVSGDSLILVGDGRQTLAAYDLDGALRGQARLPGILPLAAATPCPGEWLLYGPRWSGLNGGRVVSWLHRVRFTKPDSVEVQSLLQDTLPRYTSVGLQYGLVADQNSAVLRHTLSGRPRILRFDCRNSKLRVLRQHEASHVEPPARSGAGQLRTAVTPGMRSPAGLALLNDNILAYAERTAAARTQAHAILTLVAPKRDRTLSIRGNYVLQDSRPDVGVLVSTSDPVPQVFLVTFKDFQGMFAAD